MEKAKEKLHYSICISGASAGITVKKSYKLAIKLGQAVAHSGQILTTGATVGLPYYAASAARRAGGVSIGFSPAASLTEHVRKYKLPYDCYDFVNFTGLHYVGRDLYLVQSSDALITIGGRFGSLHEFTSALEAGKPCGILIGSGGTADVIPSLMNLLEPPHKNLVIYDDNPDRLVAKIISILDEKYADLKRDIDKHNEHWYLDVEPKPERFG
jgi:hypothetical protein